MTAVHNTPKPLLNTSPVQPRDDRAHAWAFVFQCWQEKQKDRPTTSGPDGTKGGSSDSSAKTSIP